MHWVEGTYQSGISSHAQFPQQNPLALSSSYSGIKQTLVFAMAPRDESLDLCLWAEKKAAALTVTTSWCALVHVPPHSHWHGDMCCQWHWETKCFQIAQCTQNWDPEQVPWRDIPDAYIPFLKKQNKNNSLAHRPSPRCSPLIHVPPGKFSTSYFTFNSAPLLSSTLAKLSKQLKSKQ